MDLTLLFRCLGSGAYPRFSDVQAHLMKRKPNSLCKFRLRSMGMDDGSQTSMPQSSRRDKM